MPKQPKSTQKSNTKTSYSKLSFNREKKKLQKRKSPAGRPRTVPDLAVAKLLAQRDLTQTAIAKLLNISVASVRRVAAEIKQTDGIDDVNAKLAAYRAEISEKIPISARTNALQRAVTSVKTNPFASMRAVEYCDQIEGIHPGQQIPPNQQDTDKYRPLFVFPPGAKISMTADIPRTEIDVTPEAKTDDET